MLAVPGMRIKIEKRILFFLPTAAGS